MLRLVRCYSTNQQQKASIVSFLDRMDALYSSKAGKPGAPVSKRPIDFQMKKGQKAPSRAQADKRPRSATRFQSPRPQTAQRRPNTKASSQTSSSSSPNTVVRKRDTSKLADDSYESLMTEKLEVHVTPKQFTNTVRRTRIQSNRPSSAGGARRGGQQRIPGQIKAKFQKAGGAKGQQKGGYKRTRKPAGQRQQDDSQRGVISPSEALAVLKRKVESPTNGFIQVESLSQQQLVPQFSTATTFDGRLWSAAKRFSGENVDQVVNHSIKGMSTDITVQKFGDNVAATSITNNLNAQSTYPHHFKTTLIDIASGKTGLASLKK